MPDCHLCRLNGHPARRCIKCKGPSAKPANHGQRIVSFDAMPESEIAKLKVIPAGSRETKFADFMRLWLRMPARSRDMLARAIVSQPRSNAAIARASGISRQAVSKNLIKLATEHPELRTVLRLRMYATRRGNNTKK
jgi:DNA-binding phage protein